MRYGNDYLVLLGKETSYGTEQTSYTATLPDTCVMKTTKSTIDVKQKAYGYEEKKDSVQAGYTGGTVEISGELGLDAGITQHGILFAAFFDDDTTPFVNQAVGTSKQSYTIYRAYSDGAKVDVALGCVLESLKLSGGSGDAIKYSATFRAKSVAFEQFPILATPTYPEIQPLLFCDVTAKIQGSTGHAINSFDLTLTNTFVEDSKIYQNSCTKKGEYKTGFTGELKIEKNYDETNDADIITNLLSTSLTPDTITLNNSDSSHRFAITTYGKTTDVNLPDPDNSIFQFDFTKKLMADNSNVAIEIAYT